jgi:hypothetical protein
MKLNISGDEIVKILNYPEMQELREKVAGAILGLCYSPELQSAVEEAVTKKAEQLADTRIKTALDSALTVKSVSYGSEKDIVGWGANILKDEIKRQVSKMPNIEATIKTWVEVEVNKRFDAVLKAELQAAARTVLTESFADYWAKRYADVDIQKMVDMEVRKGFARMVQGSNTKEE